MSYSTWTTDGYGFCVDDIETTAEKLLALAAMKPNVLKDIREYLDCMFEEDGGYIDEDLLMDVFDDLEGDYCERGIAYVLYNVIDEIDIVFADDYNGVPYILYDPKYPWSMNEREKNLTREDVDNIFNKYISILTDKPVRIDYYSVENGGWSNEQLYRI